MLNSLGMLTFFFLSFVWAQEPITADLRLQVEDATYVHVLQRVNTKMSEVVIHNCKCDFEEKYRSIYTDKIKRIVPIQLDEDSWVLRIFFYIDIYNVDVTVSNGYMDIWVLEDRGLERVEYDSPYSMEEFLYSTEDDIDQTYPPDIKLQFLHGSALSLPLQFDQQFFMLCSPKESLRTMSLMDLKAHLDEMKNQALFTEWGDALYALGWRYYQEGLLLEADYYFEKHQDRIGSSSPRCRAIVDTHLALQQKNWDNYQKGVQSAFAYGASDLQTLGALAYLSHEKGYPSRKKIAQALRAATAEPNHLLLAAELFQMSGHYHESSEILEDLYARGTFLDEPEKDQRVALRYGDSLLVEDRVSDAKKVWRGIPQELFMMRHVLSLMNEDVDAHATWPQNIPFLYRIANSYSSEPEARVEAMYMIAQVNTILDSRMQALRAWKKLLQDFSDVGQKSDGGANLWALYYLEIMDLHEKGLWGDIIELHEEIWFDDMLAFALDPQVFQHVIDAYMNFGFEEEAIALTRKLRPQQMPFFSEEEEALSFLTTARLYRQKPHGVGEGLATLDQIATKNVSAKTKNEIDILRAELLMDIQKYEEAVNVLNTVKASRQFRVPAQYLLGVAYAEQNKCALSVQEAQPSLLSQATIDKVFSIVHVYNLAKCAAQQGQKNNALAYLEYAKIQELTAEEKSRVDYLISEYGGAVPDIPKGAEEENLLWNKIRKEKQENDSFTSDFQKWKSQSK